MKLIAKNICVDRGSRRVVENVSFYLSKGDALVVTGENGAGKSTLLRALADLLPIASGSLELEGMDVDAKINEHCHYLGHKNGMKDALSVRENLEFWHAFSGQSGNDIETALTQVEMSHATDLPFGFLSTGMKRRVAIAKLLVNRRDVWIVDEPTSGLDAHSVKMFTAMCQQFCSDGGILIAATHLPLGLKNTKTLELDRVISSYDGDEI